jgi:hypothetical protein
MIRFKRFWLFPLCMLMNSFLKPVQGAVVTGTVRDASGATVSQALVSFILASDTTVQFQDRTDQQGNYTIDIDISVDVDQDHRKADIPLHITLLQNVPNPFNPSTRISFQIDRDMEVYLAVVNVLGQTVRVLADQKMNRGSYTVFWNGRDHSGRGVGAGLYICMMKTEEAVLSRKIILSDGTASPRQTKPPFSRPADRTVASNNTNMVNVAIAGKGLLPFTMSGVAVTGDMTLDFTVERAPAKQLVLDRSITLDGGFQGDDAAYGFIFDQDGNLYVSGFVTVPGEDRNIWLAKYDAGMNPIISKTVNGSADGEDTGYTFALDENNNLFIIGYITETGEDHNIWIAKYDLNLNLQKQITVNGSKNETDDGYGILYDGNGHLYTAGTVREIEGESNIWIAKYDTNLTLIKDTTLNRTDNMTDKARFMVLDGNGHLFVSGSVSQEISEYDIWIGKFDTDLTLLAETDLAGPVAGEEDKGYGICLDEFGILYCAGTLTEPGQGYNIWLAKYDSDLNPIASITRDGPLHGEDVAYVMVMDDLGYLYLTGVYTEPAGNENVWIGIYNRDLQLQNETTVDGPAGVYDSGIGIATRPDGIYVSGFLTDITEGGNIWLARYNRVDP